MAAQDYQPTQWNFTDLNDSLIQHHTIGILLIIVIFSITLLIAFIYLYHNFIRRYAHPSSTNLSSPPPAPLAAQPCGLDSATINNLPIFLHRSPSISIVKETECSICLGLFEDEEVIKVLPLCNHAYHSDCVDKWLSARSSCPLCRANLEVNL